MFEAARALAGRAVTERLVLLANHLVGAEPAASGRLRAHAGRSVGFRFDGWPGLLPALPSALFGITPAGLFEWRGEGAAEAADLVVGIDASNPALAAWRALAGERPAVTIAGDAAFAADVNWLFDNLRWDVEDDLARIVGDAPARELGKLGAAVAKAMRGAAQTLRGFAGRDGGDAGGPPPR